MELVERLDRMVNAAWTVIRSDFDDQAMLNWKKSARDCLVSLVGEHHYYTEQFDRQIRELDGQKTVLVCCGILSAAKESSGSAISDTKLEFPTQSSS